MKKIIVACSAFVLSVGLIVATLNAAQQTGLDKLILIHSNDVLTTISATNVDDAIKRFDENAARGVSTNFLSVINGVTNMECYWQGVLTNRVEQ